MPNPLDEHTTGEGTGPQLRRLQDWWLDLPLSYRVNALLYFLGACFTLFLVVTLLSGDKGARQVQVGAGVSPSSTTTSARAAATSATSAPGASSSSTGPTTTGAGATTTTVARAPANVGPVAGPPPTTAGTSPPVTLGTTTPSPPETTATTTTTTTRVCRNSTDAACGQFRWDPAPNNQPVAIDIATSPGTPQVGKEVTFNVTVSDPDHTIGACAVMDFGDGPGASSTQGSCPAPPCPTPARYGPWDTPPPGVAGTRIFTFTHTYSAAGPFIATFTVDDRSDCLDPYGQQAVKHAPVVLG